MICSKCKTEIENSSNFCSSCGTSTQVTCVFCNKSIKSHYLFCQNCGKSKRARFCKVCKNELDEECKFCPYCGLKTEVNQTELVFTPCQETSESAVHDITKRTKQAEKKDDSCQTGDDAFQNSREDGHNTQDTAEPVTLHQTEVNQTELGFTPCQETSESAVHDITKRTKQAEKKDDSCQTGDDAFQNSREDGHNTQDTAEPVTLHQSGELDTNSRGILKTIADTFDKRGIAVVKERIQKDLDFWKSCPINIAVIGESGTGKSSFINALLQLDPSDEQAAQVGIKETTFDMKPYPHPKHPNLEFWDLPGVGTPNFPKDTYLERICINRYDFFIVTSQGRFKENEAWLAKEIIALGKRFYFVRTMIDFDIMKDKSARGIKHNPDTVVNVIRSDCIENLKKANVSDPQVFLVCNYDIANYDFNKLFEQLKNDAPESKKEALVLCFAAISPKVIEEKCKILTSRIYKVALLSSAAAAIPIPGTGLLVDFMLMGSETAFYREQLGTSDESLGRIATHLNMSLDELKVQVDLKSSLIFRSKVAFCNMFAGLVVSEIIEDTTKTLFPIIGSIIAMVTTYPTSVYIQKHLLNICASEAYRVLKFKPSCLD
ncbi:hypothetical protein DPMN_138512 [Dreissena polymorpha]|uniref:IRG-type G domain-containing protein n=1 Tax=Dreissena polymorpha TaxID=45954 RepID=A0A9D4JER3_DREPO|nr:hypothetical protein DPMN_138512 [Dreissena polymorpha]